MRLWRGMNNESGSSRPRDIGTLKFGREILSRMVTRSPEVSPNLSWIWGLPLYRSLKSLGGTSNLTLFFPFSMNTGSSGRSINSNKLRLDDILHKNYSSSIHVELILIMHCCFNRPKKSKQYLELLRYLYTNFIRDSSHKTSYFAFNRREKKKKEYFLHINAFANQWPPNSNKTENR